MISSEGTIANYWENNCHGDDKHFTWQALVPTLTSPSVNSSGFVNLLGGS